MGLGDRIKELIAEQGVPYNEKARTIYTTCPICDQSDKFSILKDNGSCICYRGSCEFGKRWFADWLALTANITIKEAKDLLYSTDAIRFDPKEEIKTGFISDDDDISDPLKDMSPIVFPENHMMKIGSPYADEGQAYLVSRGIPPETASKYGLYFSPMLRRVVFPITMGSKVYGFQGRHIDKVSDDFKMRNNEGFKRERMVMFGDNLKNSEHVIICEGPVDAIKFDKVGGAVCTMGKVISEKQRAFIFKHNIKKVYLALDDDAYEEMNELLSQIKLPVYKIHIPDTCRVRCDQMNKKPDFGECTFDECEEAFKNAEKIDEFHIFNYWNG
jgi:hypothetical protein